MVVYCFTKFLDVDGDEDEDVGGRNVRGRAGSDRDEVANENCGGAKLVDGHK